MTKILCIETASGKCSVSIGTDDCLKYYKKDLKPNNQSENIVPMINESLDYMNLEFKDIDYLALTSGPGSFTGVRIAISAALALCYHNKMNSMVFNSFEVLEYRLRMQVKYFDYSVILISAGKYDSYIKINGPKAFEKIDIINNEKIYDFLKELEGIVAVCGNITFLNNNDFINDYKKNKKLIMLPRFKEADAKSLYKLAIERLKTNKKFSSELKPYYLKLPGTYT